ncbi:MAG: DNA internalization-related competence protein ComEC/Rec2 [Deltaproteobacteria bacterium]|nr:DNA internalization-related competence protein ComEC/Rec2 [Deltaproteobacteria bacterium]
MAPALMLFVVAFCGAVLGVTSSLPIRPLVLSTLVCGGALWLQGRWLQKLVRRHVPISIALNEHRLALLRAFALFGLCFLASFTSSRMHVDAHHQLLEPLPFREKVVLQGVAVDVAPGRNGRIRVDLRLEKLWLGTTAMPGGQVIRVQFTSSATLLQVRAGDRLRVRGVLRSLLPALSPGTFDAELFGLSRGLHGRLTVRNAEQVARLERGAEAAFFANIRTHLRTKLLSQVPEREAGVVLALLVGDTATFDDEQNLIYRKVGAGHLLAVSGLQVTLIAVIVFQCMTWILAALPWTGRRNRVRKWAAASSLLAVWGFVGLCGAPPSCVRAAAMATAGIFALFLGRRAKGVEAFGVAGVVTLFLSPLSVIDPSFLLSYAAVLGLLVAQIPTPPPKDDSQKERLQWRRVQLAALLLSAGAAGVLTLPISAALFGEISPGGLLANVVLVPAAATLQIPAIFLGLSGALLDAPFLTHWGALAAGILEALTEGCGNLVGGLVTVPAPSGLQTISLMLGAVAFIGVLRPKARWRRILLCVSMFFCVLAFAPTFFQPAGLRISVLPVGQGDGAVMELPDGTVFVVDGGGVWDEHLQPGTDVMLPFLRRRGIEKIDVMVLSHPHPDHLLGLLDILEIIEVKELWHSGYHADDRLMYRLLKSAKAHRVKVRAAKSLYGKHDFGAVQVQVLTPHPEDDTSLFEELSVNDNSLTLRFVHRKTSALWPGDLEFWGEHYLLRDHRNAVASTVLKAPHHGSKTSSTAAFVKAVSPEIVVFPTGLHNQWGFPHPSVVERYRSTKATLLDTALHGEITLWLTGDEVVFRTFKNTIFSK